MARRNRIIYPSNAVWANGNVLYRVQTFGSTTTFNTEDVFELGQLNIIDVVDDSPTVAVTIETNEFGSLSNLYALANLEQDNVLVHDATSVSGHLTVVSGLGDDAVNIAYYHGVALTDFGLSAVCGNSSVEIWAPIQDECSIGTDNDLIEQTMFLPRVFVNSVEWTYSAGANATENYGGETDAKFWFVNDGRFVSSEEFVYTAAATGTDPDPNDGTTGGTGWKIISTATSVFLGLDQNAATPELVSTRSTGQLAFLRFDNFGNPAVRYYNASAGATTEIPVQAGSAATAGAYVYNSATNELFDPTDLTTNADLLGEAKAAGDILMVVYAANAFANSFAGLAGATQAARSGAANTSRMATRRDAEYFAPIEVDTAHKPEDLGAVRQGQIEIYLIDKDVLDPTFDLDDQLALRLTSVTIAADLTREPLFELSHLRPYDRSLTFPIPFTVTVESTANDLVEYATLASKKQGVVIDGTTDEISIYDFMTANTRLDLVVQIYQQTDEEAGGTGSNRRVVTREMVGDEYYQRGQRSIYYDGVLGSDPDFPATNFGSTIPAVPTKSNTHRERPLKTIIAKDLRITDEAYNLAMGENATQTFGFRGSNNLFAVLGEVDVADMVASPGLQVNPDARRLF